LTKKRVAAGLSQIYGPKAVESGLSQAKGNISFLEVASAIVLGSLQFSGIGCRISINMQGTIHIQWIAIDRERERQV